jgi:ubiquinone/menaquinone biosynthesis C-methylase UbiE
MNTMIREKSLTYARYRLPYADEAVCFVIEQTNAQHGTMADLGAGTGLLTRHFVDWVEKVYAIEPEPEMRMICEEELGKNIITLDGVAEATGLPDQSVDLIVAANAYHRFQPEKTLQEFRRILKPHGWLAIFSYHDDTNFLRETVQIGQIPQLMKRLQQTRHIEPVSYFYGNVTPTRHLFSQAHIETWDEYWGAVLSGMESPAIEEGWFTEFREAHQKRFAQFAVDGQLTIRYSTEVWLGQPNYAHLDKK